MTDDAHSIVIHQMRRRVDELKDKVLICQTAKLEAALRLETALASCGVSPGLTHRSIDARLESAVSKVCDWMLAEQLPPPPPSPVAK